MKTIGVLLISVLLALAGAASASAAVKAGDFTKVKIYLENITPRPGIYTVFLQARNRQGAKVATLAKAVELKPGGSQKVEFEWQAPKEATLLEWKPLVVKGIVGELALSPMEADGKNDEVKEKDKEEDLTGGDDF